MSSAKRKALGRGLEALIPASAESRADDPDRQDLFQCPIDQLVPNEEQPRQSFDEARLRELTESVRAKGVIQPLVVRALDDGRFQIVAGERRWRASRLAGLERVPVVVQDISGTEALELALIENIQREDLNPLEEAEAYRQLIEDHGLTQESLATRVGRQRSTVANALRLLKLPEYVQNHLLTGELSMGHARAILGIDSASGRKAVARKVVREGLSVRACEQLVRNQAKRSSRSRPAAAKSRPLGPAQRKLVEDLQRRFGTKVELQPKRRGGKLIIHYYSNEEFDRVLDVLERR